jgi:hypothetical protein
MKKQTLFDNWAGGVISTMHSNALPNAASPRGRNSILAFLAGGKAVAAKRPGFEILNTEPMTGRPSVLGQFEFNRDDAGTPTTTHLLVGSDGALSTPDGVNAPVPVDAGEATPFAAGNSLPQFTVLNDLCFIIKGDEHIKLASDGTVQSWGIERPAAPTVVANAAAGNPNGTYEFAISYYNSTTGHESSRSNATSVTVTSDKIDVSWTAPVDPQVDYVFVHVRKGSIMSDFFRLIVGVTPAVAGNGGYAVATLATLVDVTDAQLTALEILSPDTAENEPPPDALVDATPHLSRLFVADKNNVYWSKVGKPEAFDPDFYEPVNPGDGGDIVAIRSFFPNQLTVFKTESLHGIFGSDPASWEVDVIDPKVGATSAASIKFHEGVAYWWSKQGPVAWAPGSAPTEIGLDLIAPSISREVLNHERLDQVVAEVETELSTVLFAVPESGETRNTLILPFNVKGKTWNSDGWNPFDVASMAVVKDANGKPWIVAGNYGGRLFRFANAFTDGARTVDSVSTELTLEGTPTSATASSLTDTTATFDTEDDGLMELFVYAVAPDGQVQRRRISSNTATVLSITPDWDAVPDSTYTYSIAAPHWQWDTKWVDEGEPFYQKRGLHHFCQVLADSGAATIQVDVFADYDAFNPVKTFTFEASGEGGIFDVSLFDEAIFGEVGITYDRRWVGRKFRAYRLRYSNVEPNVQLALMHGSLAVKLLSEKN